MKLRFVSSALLILAFATVFGQATDPGKALKDITDFQQQQYSQAKSQADVTAAMAAIKQKAQAAIQGVDPTKVDAKDAYTWAQLFSFAGEHKATCDLAHKYLTTNPGAKEKFDVQMLMMQSCNQLGEGDMLDQTLTQTKPTDASQGMQLADEAVYEFCDTIAKTKGPQEAVKALQKVEANTPNQDTSKITDPKAKAQAEAMGQQIHFTYASKEAELLADSGQKAQGLKVLDDFSKTLPTDSRLTRTVTLTRARIALTDAAAPAIAKERAYGDFAGLDSLKGKVVILDFFAHWCPPCKASFPDEEKMYADLKDQGLAIVGVTTYYGYYENENRQKRDMPKDTEYGHMADFIKQFNIPWPIVYGDRSNFEAYGVTGIPQAVVIDRTGKVAFIDIGYSPDTFKAFRAKVEALLKK